MAAAQRHAGFRGVLEFLVLAKPGEALGFRFSPAHPDCWRRGSQELCCKQSGCWDDFWNPARCCLGQIELPEVPDSDCLGPMPGLEDLVLSEPSQERPFVFLWDEKTGGTTFNDWLLASSSQLGRLNSTHISDFGWPNVIGTPFFLKTYERSKLESLQILSATVDWNIFSALGCAPKRRPSCLILLRNPVDRFLSYYLERSDRILEGGSLPIRMLTNFSLQEFEEYLDSVRFDRLRFSGSETGLFCNTENGQLCLDDASTAEASEGGPETFAFRSFGGPQNRLARMLDPPLGRISVAKERLKRCTVSLQNEDFSNHLRVLRKFQPWISQVHFADSDASMQNSYNRRESAYLRDHLPEAFRRAIAEFNSADMELYHQGVEQFYQQVTLARKNSLLPVSSLWPESITLPSKDWEVTWRFFQEELPTTFFIRRLTRCRITRLASQCAKLVGESMPDGVDYQLQPELTEHILQVISHEFYQRPPQEFYQLRSHDWMRLHGSDAKGAPHRVVALPDFGELLDDAWGEAQRRLR